MEKRTIRTGIRRAEGIIAILVAATLGELFVVAKAQAISVARGKEKARERFL